MRFLSDGPNIPDQLLERRDQGRVVFLCGAGVSFNSGMPGFADLTKQVFEFFDPPEDSTLAKAFGPWEKGSSEPKIPLDQIFHMLHQEFGRDDVNAIVAERLWTGTKGRKASKEHKLIARISADQKGLPQIVTTNFDRLFEEAVKGKKIATYEPPEFPEISLGVPVSGITYLHGRIQDPKANQHSYVLGSADFGRAYLAEGWATKFIRSLLVNYTVVLVGYQAEDPPVKYLLQGLNYDEWSESSNLFAFDKGHHEDIEAKWRDRGVNAIAYGDHPVLWQTFEAWAERADNPREWKSQVIKLTMNGPSKVEPHERGQVAHLVRTTPGARLFARTDPPPPADWLCVFDASCRAVQKSHSYDDDEKSFDPLEFYGLDDDPPHPTESEDQAKFLYDNILEWRRTDQNPPGLHKLGNRPPPGWESMPPRLSHLAAWISKSIGSPAAAWWALRQKGIHPRLLEWIRLEVLKDRSLPAVARDIWNRIIEYQSDNRSFNRDHEWFDLKRKIIHERWSLAVVRDYESATEPHISNSRMFGIGSAMPPSENWNQINPKKLVSWKVSFPKQHGDPIEIPEKWLEPVFRVLERNLIRAAELMEEIGETYFRTPTCYPNRDVKGEDRNKDPNFKTFLELFTRMIASNSGTARSHALTWPVDQQFYFRQLKLFALNQKSLFEADEAAKIVLGLNQVQFWGKDAIRELLFLVLDRCSEFSSEIKHELVERILKGPDKKDSWPEENFPQIRDRTASSYVRWLTLNGCEITDEHQTKLEEKISSLAEWNDAWVANLATDFHGRSGFVAVDEKTDSIVDLPVNEIVGEAQAERRRNLDTLTDFNPFAGLVKANPRKAMAALSHSARKGEYPSNLWTDLLQEWPEPVKPRLFRVFLHRLARLPNDAISELQYPIGYWLKTKFLLALDYDAGLAWEAFDHLVSGLFAGGNDATQSGLGEVFIGGKSVDKSRRTYSHAINGPVGQGAEGLIQALFSQQHKENHEIPSDFKTRFEQLLCSPGEGADHVVSILCHEINRLFLLDPEWVRKNCLPWFHFDSALTEPAWNGFLSAHSMLLEELGIEMKPLLQKIFPKIHNWDWSRELDNVAADIIINLAILHSGKPDALSRKEARSCIRAMRNGNRQHAVFRLSQIGKTENKGWGSYVIPFIETVWPRERVFRTTSLANSWLNLLDDTGEDFPKVLDAVRRFLIPIEGESYGFYRFGREIGGEEPLTVKHPDAVLELLDAVVSNKFNETPYELAEILDLIEEVDPGLVRDSRFLRLINLVEHT